jgi:hypothetical protein
MTLAPSCADCLEVWESQLPATLRASTGVFLHLLMVNLTFAKLLKATQLRHVCLSVCSHGTTRLPLDGFSCSLASEDFLKIGLENSTYI